MSGWDLVGEEAEAIYHPGLLPLDWRTRAKALLASDLGRYEALEAQERQDGAKKQRLPTPDQLRARAGQRTEARA